MSCGLLGYSLKMLNSHIQIRTIMKVKGIFMVLSLLLFVGCSGNPVRDAIARQLEMYPQSRVQDIYKNFCQDNLGPGHLIPNQDAAKDYLLSELASYREDLDSARYAKPGLRYVPVGDRGNYVRVDLSVVLDGLVDADTLLDAFVRSANEGKTLSEQQWKRKWSAVAAVVRKDFQDIPDAARDLARIDTLLTQGHLILHHSDEFNAEYHPHYRIVSREVFEGLNIGSNVNNQKPMNMNNAINEVPGRKNFGSSHALLTTPQPCVMIATWDKDHNPDVMMAAWAGQYDYNQIVVSLSKHKTTDNLEATGAFTISFADERTVAESDYFGLVSGNKVPDKVARVGFTVTPSPNVDAPIINEYPLTLECKVVSLSDGILIGEVVNQSADESVLTDGKVDLAKLKPIVFDAAANVYRVLGEPVGGAWSAGKKFVK